MIAEYRLRLERAKGNWLEENVPHGGDRRTEDFKVDALNIEKIGISKHESSVSRQIASIPEDTFEDFIKEKKQAVNDAVAESLRS